jgi:hypothetical protein
MDPATWEKSLRSSLFYKFTLNHVFLLCVANVILYSVAPFGKQLVIDMHFLVVLVTTFILSLVAYFITDVFIEQMKTKLCEKGGLFGKDLNKLGD